MSSDLREKVRAILKMRSGRLWGSILEPDRPAAMQRVRSLMLIGGGASEAEADAHVANLEHERTVAECRWMTDIEEACERIVSLEEDGKAQDADRLIDALPSPLREDVQRILLTARMTPDSGHGMDGKPLDKTQLHAALKKENFRPRPASANALYAFLRRQPALEPDDAGARGRNKPHKWRLSRVKKHLSNHYKTQLSPMTPKSTNQR